MASRSGMLTDARRRALAILNDPDYVTNLLVRAKAGILHPSVEVMLWHYSFTKPTDHIEVADVAAMKLADMTPEELALRADRISLALREQAAEDARRRQAEAAAQNPSMDLSLMREPGKAEPFDSGSGKVH
jgi:hypothetical protein